MYFICKNYSALVASYPDQNYTAWLTTRKSTNVKYEIKMHTILTCSNTQLTNSRFYNQQMQQRLTSDITQPSIIHTLKQTWSNTWTAKCASNTANTINSTFQWSQYGSNNKNYIRKWTQTQNASQVAFLMPISNNTHNWSTVAPYNHSHVKYRYMSSTDM